MGRRVMLQFTIDLLISPKGNGLESCKTYKGSIDLREGGDKEVGYRMVGKCPKCQETLSLNEIRIERWYTEQGETRYMLVCKKCESIIGVSS